MRPLRRCSGDDGAAAVELALILPFLALVGFGLIDYGNAYRQENLLQIGVMGATRTASQLGRNRLADYEALRTVSSAVSAMNGTTLTKVIIWKANNQNTPPCLNVPLTAGPNGTTGLCNVYSPAQVDATTAAGFAGPSTGGCTANNWSRNWCPSGVGGRVNTEGFGDYIGVYVELSYKPFTAYVSSRNLTISEYAIYRLEPPFVGAT